MIRVAIIVGSTRPGRRAEIVARWVYGIASKRSDAEFEVVDILDFNLPLLDEPMSPSRGVYTQPHTKAWSAKIDSFDAFVFVTSEYNHGPSGVISWAVALQTVRTAERAGPVHDTTRNEPFKRGAMEQWYDRAIC